MKILIVEDHPKLRENIIKYFKLKGHLIEWAIHGKEALDKVSQSSYEAVILDINLPIMDGKTFLKKLREKWNYTPVIALTSNSLLEDKIEVFGIWVDDYLTKPFELAELEARVHALSRRKNIIEQEVIHFWDVEIDIWKRKIFKKWSEIDVGNKEFLILEFLSKNIGYPKSKQEIIEYAWWESESKLIFESVTLEAHISYLRKKLGKNIIKTLKWVWYVIEK